jgi:hypothetical protein
MRRAAFVVLAILVTFLATASPVRAVEPSEWHSEQPVAAGVEVPVLLGEIGDIECWAANRCVLITAGNTGISAGIYAYDGRGWYRYSTVCGGHHGRIAWAGPDEFWTISDQRAGEEVNVGNHEGELQNRSLCHFKNGEVVASYAEPLGQVGSYYRMNAADCEGPDDCWFAGERLTGEPDVGAFHLHWDGSSLSAVPSLTEAELALADPGRTVFGLTFYQQQLYESVSVKVDDQPENETEPSLLHRVTLGAAQPFEPLSTPGLVTGGTLEGLEGFRFASDDSALWALSGAAENGGTSTTPTLLTLEADAFHQVPLTGTVFGAGSRILSFAMEPTSDGDAWASFLPRGGNQSGPARLARIEAGATSGSVGDEVQLPRPEEGLNNKGVAGPVACPAAGQCWMATSKGWLFHLGGPPAEGPNSDPAMHQFIAFRPCDDACQSGVETGLPEDNSGAEPEAEQFAEVEAYEPLPVHSKSRPLYNHLKQKLIDRMILQVTFDLHARAHVQLIAKERKKIVAKTPRMTLEKGHHRIRLRLDPAHWPTHLSFRVHRIKTKRAS